MGALRGHGHGEIRVGTVSQSDSLSASGNIRLWRDSTDGSIDSRAAQSGDMH